MANRDLRKSIKKHQTGNPISDAYSIMQETGSGPLGYEEWPEEDLFFDTFVPIMIVVGLILAFLTLIF